LGAVRSLPTFFTTARLRGVAVTIGCITADFANWNVTVSASVTTVTFALKWSIHTPAVATALPGLALSAIAPKPTRVTRTHAGHDTISINTIFTNGLVTIHSCPTVFTLTLEWLGAFAVNATWKLDTLVTPWTSPSNVTLAGVGLGAVSVDAELAVRTFTDGNLAHGAWIRPSWKTLQSPVLFAIVMAVFFDVFWSASEMVPLVNWSV